MIRSDDTTMAESHRHMSCVSFAKVISRIDEVRSSEWLPKVAVLVPLNEHGTRQILSYCKGFLSRARGDSNTQPPDP